MSRLPYPENRGQTHHEECFRTPGHHNCAVRRVAHLEAQLAGVNGALEYRSQRIAELEAQVAEFETEGS